MRPSTKDKRKANRKGSRDAELENSSGWSSVDRPHISVKTYKRNEKHKKSYI